MNILIATGIYPPDIGGPAQYAYNLNQTFTKKGHVVHVSHFGRIERLLPTGLRHIYYAFKTARSYIKADTVLVLDTFSVAWSIYMLSFVFGKKYTIRTGGDFLWENYTQRTGKKVLLKDFYLSEKPFFNTKEKLIYKITKKIIARANILLFSTQWQKDIWTTPYELHTINTGLIENYYNIPSEKKQVPDEVYQTKKICITGTRDLVWKNKDTLLQVLQRIQKDHPEYNLEVDNTIYPHKTYIEHMEQSYAVILMSLGDISPNMILDSIRAGKPFLLTKENGIFDKIKDFGLFADPLDPEDIYQKIIQLCDKDIYKKLEQSLQTYTYRHTWEDITDEYLHMWQK